MSRSRPIIIGVCGGSSSGKTSVCKSIMSQISNLDKNGHVEMLSMNSFYRELTPEDAQKADNGEYNFDHPNAFDLKLMDETLRRIRRSEVVKVSNYDVTKRVHDGFRTLDFANIDVLLVEGILVFYQKEIREQFNLKLFVDCDSDTRLARRVRSHVDLGRPLEQILKVYSTLVKPAFEEFCLPSKKYADVIIPRGADNEVAIDLIVQHVKDVLYGSYDNGDCPSPPKRLRSPLPQADNNQYRPRPH